MVCPSTEFRPQVERQIPAQGQDLVDGPFHVDGQVRNLNEWQFSSFVREVNRLLIETEVVSVLLRIQLEMLAGRNPMMEKSNHLVLKTHQLSDGPSIRLDSIEKLENFDSIQVEK